MPYTTCQIQLEKPLMSIWERVINHSQLSRLFKGLCGGVPLSGGMKQSNQPMHTQNDLNLPPKIDVAEKDGR